MLPTGIVEIAPRVGLGVPVRRNMARRCPARGAQRGDAVTEAARSPLHLAVALEGAGWHPRAWREPAARPGDLLTAGYWASLVAEAEEGLLDFVTFEDSFGLQPRARPAAGRAGAARCRAAGRRPDRGPGRAADPACRADPDRHRDPYRAVPHLQGHRHPGLRQPGPGRHAGADLGPAGRGGAVRPAPGHPRAGRGRRGSRAGGGRAVRRGGRLRRGGPAAVGFAGRTTPRSATWPPAGSWTASSCTTSTSRAAGSASAGRRSRRGRRRASRWWPRWRTGPSLPPGRPQR